MALVAVGISLLASPLHAQGDSTDRQVHTRGLFIGFGGGQATLKSPSLRPPSEPRYGPAGRVGYGFGDLAALVVSGELARVDFDYDGSRDEYEFGHVALSARLHPFRAGRFGPFVEGTWLRYVATTDRASPTAPSVTSRVTLEGTGAGAGAGLHFFLSRALSLEGSAAWTDGKLTRATISGVRGTFDPAPLRSRLYRLSLTWWLGT